jgi:hypothetical protein
MRTVLFVHGTGTREPSYSGMLEKVKAALQDNASVQPCYWGEQEGARLNGGGASIPTYDTTRISPGPTGSDKQVVAEEDFEIALWELLLKDPLFELRLLADLSNEGEERSPDSPGLAFDRLKYSVSGAEGGQNVKHGILEANLSSVLVQACNMVESSETYEEAESACGGVAICKPVARAILAKAFQLAIDRELRMPARSDSNLRDEVIGDFCQALSIAGADKEISERGFLGQHVAKHLVGFATHLGAKAASDYVRRRRGAVQDASSAAAGDVLLYQAKGLRIREFIKGCVNASPTPVVLLAHSLGGIACVDLLILEKIPKVEVLVTVGCQAPFLYEINALQSLQFADLQPNERLPEHFPRRWINFYDLRDFLSFVAAPIFGNRRVTDICVDNNLPFPDSHGGYFTNDDVWRQVLQTLGKTSN